MKHKLLCVAFLAIGTSSAQKLMTLQETIALGLQNNYSVLLAKNDSTIAANDAKPGAAGMLPSITFNALASKASNNIKQHYATGLELTRNGVGSSTLGSSVALNWTLFDGFKMFATLDRLKEIAAQGELKVRQQMENTVASIIAAYYNIARQKQQMQAINELVSVYEERVRIADARLELGNGNRSDLLQAKVDLNEQKSALYKQKTLIANGKSALNLLLAREPSTDFDVADSAVLEEPASRDALLKSMETRNSELKIASSQQKIAFLQFRENQSFFYPKVGLGVTYNFSQNSNQAGLTLLNQSLGLNYGLNLSWNIFNGSAVKRSVQDAQVAAFSARLQYELAKKQQQDKLIQAYNRLQEALDLVKLEEESTKLAQENVSIMLERFKLGQSTTLELKDAQNSLLSAKTRLVNARYDAKVAETDVKRVEGTLL